MRQGILPRNRGSSYYGGTPHHRIVRLRPTSVTPATTGHLHGHFTDKELRP